MDNKPWLKNYDKGVPATLQPYLNRTLIDVVRETAGLRPNHPALLFKGAKMSYSELDRLSDALAQALIAQGIKKGDRVAVVMPNVPQFVIAEFGIWKAGGVVACINPLYTEYELTHALNECGAETAIVMTLFYDKVKAVQSKTKVKRVIATNVKDYLPFIKRLLFTYSRKRRTATASRLNRVISRFRTWSRRTRARASRPSPSAASTTRSSCSPAAPPACPRRPWATTWGW
jgi:long-chain acyl-CoA synthetase